MPTYQYACTDCGDRSEVVQKFTDDPLSVCTACGGKLRKVFSPVGIVFKGSGFYRTDSRSSSKVTADGGGKDGGGKDGGAKDRAKSGSDSSSGGDSSASKNGSDSGGSQGGKKSETSGSASGSSSGSTSAGSSSGSKVA